MGSACPAWVSSLKALSSSPAAIWHAYMLHQYHGFALRAESAHSSLCHGGHLRPFRTGRDRRERALCVLSLGRLFVHKSLRDTLVERENAVDVSDLRRFRMRRGQRDGRRAGFGARRATAALVLQLGLDVLRILVRARGRERRVCRAVRPCSRKERRGELALWAPPGEGGRGEHGGEERVREGDEVQRGTGQRRAVCAAGAGHHCACQCGRRETAVGNSCDGFDVPLSSSSKHNTCHSGTCTSKRPSALGRSLAPACLFRPTLSPHANKLLCGTQEVIFYTLSNGEQKQCTADLESATAVCCLASRAFAVNVACIYAVCSTEKVACTRHLNVMLNPNPRKEYARSRECPSRPC